MLEKFDVNFSNPCDGLDCSFGSAWDNGGASDHGLPRLASSADLLSMLSGALPSGVACKDSEELQAWVLSAEVGYKKVFDVSQERRKHLHRAVDLINTNSSAIHDFFLSTMAFGIFSPRFTLRHMTIRFSPLIVHVRARSLVSTHLLRLRLRARPCTPTLACM